MYIFLYKHTTLHMHVISNHWVLGGPMVLAIMNYCYCVMKCHVPCNIVLWRATPCSVHTTVIYYNTAPPNINT